jgi:hypothetical protein
MAVKVDKNIPIPVKFPFAGMQVGDSFAVPPDVKRPAVTVAAMRFGRRHGMRFTVRQVADKTYRCWRIE